MIDFRVPPLGLSDGAVANGGKTSLSLPGVSVCYSARLNRGSLLAPLGPNYIRAYPLFVMLFCVGMCFPFTVGKPTVPPNWDEFVPYSAFVCFVFFRGSENWDAPLFRVRMQTGRAAGALPVSENSTLKFDSQIMLSGLLLMMILEMLFQQIAAEIAIEFTPGGVYVVSIILRIRKFDQECFGLNAVVMELASFLAATPGEVEMVAISEVAQVVGPFEKFRAKTAQVDIYQTQQLFLLFGIEIRILDALIGKQSFVGDGIVGRQDFLDHAFGQEFLIHRSGVDRGNRQLIRIE